MDFTQLFFLPVTLSAAALTTSVTFSAAFRATCVTLATTPGPSACSALRARPHVFAVAPAQAGPLTDAGSVVAHVGNPPWLLHRK